MGIRREQLLSFFLHASQEVSMVWLLELVGMQLLVPSDELRAQAQKPHVIAALSPVHRVTQGVTCHLPVLQRILLIYEHTINAAP